MYSLVVFSFLKERYQVIEFGLKFSPVFCCPCWHMWVHWLKLLSATNYIRWRLNSGTVFRRVGMIFEPETLAGHQLTGHQLPLRGSDRARAGKVRDALAGPPGVTASRILATLGAALVLTVSCSERPASFLWKPRGVGARQTCVICNCHATDHIVLLKHLPATSLGQVRCELLKSETRH